MTCPLSERANVRTIIGYCMVMCNCGDGDNYQNQFHAASHIPMGYILGSAENPEAHEMELQLSLALMQSHIHSLDIRIRPQIQTIGPPLRRVRDLVPASAGNAHGVDPAYARLLPSVPSFGLEVPVRRGK